VRLKPHRTLRVPYGHVTMVQSETSQGLVEGVIEAIKDQQSALEVRLDEIALRLPGTPMAVHLSGARMVSVHMRELTPEEKEAHASASVTHWRPQIGDQPPANAPTELGQRIRPG
jgi:hypothetical protein